MNTLTYTEPEKTRHKTNFFSLPIGQAFRYSDRQDMLNSFGLFVKLSNCRAEEEYNSVQIRPDGTMELINFKLKELLYFDLYDLNIEAVLKVNQST